MKGVTLVSLQVGVALVSILIWHLLTTIPVSDGEPLFPPFFFSTPVDVIEVIPPAVNTDLGSRWSVVAAVSSA